MRTRPASVGNCSVQNNPDTYPKIWFFSAVGAWLDAEREKKCWRGLGGRVDARPP
jgi:hypothetical protein